VLLHYVCEGFREGDIRKEECVEIFILIIEGFPLLDLYLHHLEIHATVTWSELPQLIEIARASIRAILAHQMIDASLGLREELIRPIREDLG
jgi:hypothetical protein